MMSKEIINKYQLKSFAFYLITINVILLFPIVLCALYEFMEWDTSGLGGFMGFMFVPLLALIVFPIFILSFLVEILYFIEWIINRKRDNDYFHDYFVSNKFFHAYFISFILFVALVLTLYFMGDIKWKDWHYDV